MPLTTTTTTFNPVPNIPLEPTNECDVLTIFPMSAECITINPTNDETFDGAASLMITGGTPPYEILWETGGVGTIITNLNVGTYTATIKDSYGDFIINTTCELTAPPAPTTTTTTSTTTLPQFDDLCVVITTPKIGEGSSGYNYKFWDFIYNGYYNGKPSWLSDDGDYFIYWNTGTTNQWLYSGTSGSILYNTNPATPPLSGWQFLGVPKGDIYVYEGSCDGQQPLAFQITKNDSSCGNDGSIIVSATGGLPPYMYSLNGGTTTQVSPIFQGLGGGTYSVSVIDGNNTIQTQNVTIAQLAISTTYVVKLTRGYSNTFNVTINPPLPAGVSVSYDIVYGSLFKVAPQPTSATNTITSTILVDGNPIPNPSPVIINSTTFNPCDGGNFYETNSVYTWSNITMTTSTTVDGTINNTISPNSPIPQCYLGTRTTNLTLNNLQINGCQCCSTILQIIQLLG